MDLFGYSRKKNLAQNAPLARRMRPRSLEEFVGQKHIVGEGRLLTRLIRADRLSSLIFYGPPGTGKTALAQIIANTTESYFERVNAVTSGVAELRKVIAGAEERLGKEQKNTILFIDEIHRFNKAQQDALLPSVEDGVIILTGATTENPYFEVNPPLVSRSHIFRLEPLSEEQIAAIIERALEDAERGLGQYRTEVTQEAIDHLTNVANGDARSALNAIEVAVLTTPPDAEGVRRIDLQTAEEAIQKRAVTYDASGDNHYDTVSAFIKSMRGSDPDAALYWLAKMLYAGEDPRFIARRLVVHAAEDVGNADPRALLIANAAASSVEYVGLPEARIPLAQATTYIATAPKSNACVAAIDRAMRTVEQEGAKPVPAHLRDTHYKGAEELGHGEGYLYPHDFPQHIVGQNYFPEGIENRSYYRPSENGYERELKTRMKKWREQLARRNQ